MAKSFKSKRIIFPKKEQRKFLLSAKKDLDLTWTKLADLLKISLRNLTDWKNEKISLPLDAVKIICKKTNKQFPNNVEIKDPYWYASKGARKGGLAKYKKYGTIGNPEIRKKKWREWWEKEGQFKKNSITQPLPFKKPRFSECLAEFVGIVLGDGGISDHQIAITLHRITDKQYGKYISILIKKLFNIQVSVYKSPKFLADDYVISRTGLVNYCVEKLGLRKGNKIKNQVDIPEWIKKNDKFLTSCIRGLVDTDGSIYNHKYSVNGKEYSYKKMDFISLSKPLALSVYNFLKDIGTNPGYYNKKDIKIENVKGLKKYFKVVGTHNPKHLKRYEKK